MSWEFEVGQRVVCIKARPSTAPADAIYPEVHGIYTIRAINAWPHAVLLRFHEIDNSHMVGWRGEIEPGFNSNGFRPLVHEGMKTLRSLLAPSPEKEAMPA